MLQAGSFAMLDVSALGVISWYLQRFEPKKTDQLNQYFMSQKLLESGHLSTSLSYIDSNTSQFSSSFCMARQFCMSRSQNSCPPGF